MAGFAAGFAAGLAAGFATGFAAGFGAAAAGFGVARWACGRGAGALRGAFVRGGADAVLRLAAAGALRRATWLVLCEAAGAFFFTLAGAAWVRGVNLTVAGDETFCERDFGALLALGAGGVAAGFNFGAGFCVGTFAFRAAGLLVPWRLSACVCFTRAAFSGLN